MSWRSVKNSDCPGFRPPRSFFTRRCQTRGREGHCKRWLRPSASIALQPEALGLLRPMADGLDLVAVGIAQERAIIRSMIVAESRRAVIGAAGGDTGAPEGVDLGS